VGRDPRDGVDAARRQHRPADQHGSRAEPGEEPRSTFFFLTLYMQNVLGWSPIEAGAAYLPVTLGLGISASIARRLIDVPLGWAESQFSLMGRRDASDLAVALISAYQGVSLLTNTLHDPDLMLREGPPARALDRLALAGAVELAVSPPSAAGVAVGWAR
jgi:hypothetical protein